MTEQRNDNPNIGRLPNQSPNNPLFASLNPAELRTVRQLLTNSSDVVLPHMVLFQQPADQPTDMREVRRVAQDSTQEGPEKRRALAITILDRARTFEDSPAGNASRRAELQNLNTLYRFVLTNRDRETLLQLRPLMDNESPTRQDCTRKRDELTRPVQGAAPGQPRLGDAPRPPMPGDAPAQPRPGDAGLTPKDRATQLLERAKTISYPGDPARELAERRKLVDDAAELFSPPPNSGPNTPVQFMYWRLKHVTTPISNRELDDCIALMNRQDVLNPAANQDPYLRTIGMMIHLHDEADLSKRKATVEAFKQENIATYNSDPKMKRVIDALLNPDPNFRLNDVEVEHLIKNVAIATFYPREPLPPGENVPPANPGLLLSLWRGVKDVGGTALSLAVLYAIWRKIPIVNATTIPVELAAQWAWRRWRGRGGDAPAPALEARADMHRFWELVRRVEHDLNGNPDRFAEEMKNPEFRRRILAQAKGLLETEKANPADGTAGARIHREALTRIDGFIQAAGTGGDTVPEWLAAELRREPAVGSGPVDLTRMPFRQSDLWDTRVTQRDGKVYLEVEELTGRKLAFELREDDLNKVKDAYQARHEALRNKGAARSPAEQSEFDLLERHKNAGTGWASNNPLDRGAFLHEQMRNGQPRFEVTRDRLTGRISSSRIMLGAVVILFIGNLLVTDTPAPSRPVTRSRRN
jgi:hypothetical protein